MKAALPYIAHPMQTLNPLVTYNPFLQKSVIEQQARNDKINIIISVALPALAIIAFTCILNSFIISCAAGIYLYNLIEKSVVAYTLQDASNTRLIEFNTKLIERMNYLDGSEIQKRLDSFGIKPGIEPRQLRSIFARYCEYDEKRLRQDGYGPEEEAYIVEMAYLLKLMQSPYEKRTLKGFCSKSYEFNPPKDKYIHSYHGPSRIKSGNKEYRLLDLNKKDPVELAREIFELQGGAPAQSSGWFDQFSNIGNV